MKGFGFILNKYTLSVLILLCLIAADIIIHKGMSRVIIPAGFPEKIIPINLPLCNNVLLAKSKSWVKAVNDIQSMEKLPVTTPGLECDVYFDLKYKSFKVYHDSAALSTLDADSLFAVYAAKKLSANVWFDFKNLAAANYFPSLEEMIRLRNKYHLSGKIIVESSSPEFLRAFCDSGFYTSYYVPFFNPYQASEFEVIQFVNSLQKILQKYPTSAVSGYYFQYPVLKRYFPNYPILTWADKHAASFVSYIFGKQLANEESIKVVLYPQGE